MKEKLMKDPIYGYIGIDYSIMEDIVDSPCFQRLRNIRQTSYAPLYSASLHNRFTHSIGVYYLGKIAFSSLKNSIEAKFKDLIQDAEWCRLETIFMLACLLHDVGHAPFSHTGETFFLNKSEDGNIIIDKDLVDCVNTKGFENDIKYYHKGKKAAAHEIMSVIVGIRNYSKYINTPEDKEFFARCITGYNYRQDLTDLKELKNCLIGVLNSPIIDVDKLDYIIRDSYMTGFQSVSIDYFRLLSSITMVETNNIKCLAYHKSALSIIENVIYAHDSERKWIQNHPIVLYEHFLVQYAIKNVVNFFYKESNRLFSYQSLSNEGNDFGTKGKIRLLSDEDIIYNMKNICRDNLTDEYFSRDSRRHPIWKSEAEYRALFDLNLGTSKLDELEIAFQNIEKYISDNLEKPIINDSIIIHCEYELGKLEQLGNILSQKDINNKKDGLNNILKWANCLKKYCEDHSMLFDFVIISANKFKSGFIKKDVNEILIYFPSFYSSSDIRKVSTILDSSETRKNFFYLYYKRIDDEMDILEFSKFLSIELMR